MCSPFSGNKRILLIFVLFMSLICAYHCFHVEPIQCNVSLTDSCPASLYFVPKIPKSLKETAALFHVNSNLVNKTVDGFVIAVSCSCPADHDEFIWHMDYTVQPGDTWELVSSKFGSFVMEKPEKVLIAEQTITLDLLCGCYESMEILTYRVEARDTLYTICSRFKANIEKTAKLNRLVNLGLIHAGDILFIPGPDLQEAMQNGQAEMLQQMKDLFTAITQDQVYASSFLPSLVSSEELSVTMLNVPLLLTHSIFCAPVTCPKEAQDLILVFAFETSIPMAKFSLFLHENLWTGHLENLILLDNEDSKAREISKSRFHIILGAIVAAAAVVLFLVTILFWIFHHKRKGSEQSKASVGDFKCSACCLTLFPSDKKSKESVLPLFNSDKAAVFPYNEVCDATSNFSLSQKIGQGSYGSVYLGTLRGTDVAIKQMKNTKSKEFLTELNILCRVHHTNLIGLIGYAAGGDSLFLVYEFAQNGALSFHLHNPSVKGYGPLSWTRRVQIALDAAKGLEYIHVHTRPFYVHRDVKTSNILLDTNFRAKIGDFGLVKLLEHSPEVGTAASRIVGTFGYLAPEYVRDGCVTTKSDVYSYGVVLMELLTGQPALSRDARPGNAQYIEYRSVVEYMLSAFEDKNDPMAQLTRCIDPSLTHYHKDSLFQTVLDALLFRNEDAIENACSLIMGDDLGELHQIRGSKSQLPYGLVDVDAYPCERSHRVGGHGIFITAPSKGKWEIDEELLRWKLEPAAAAAAGT
ncbi:hypothetical protein HHK36_013954 [Tetracentron sinense]|uniref:Uncharacterized protein n=1 Tax=Tetracentron sinense TaxID=13715 RepID=A0A834Z566_TETSI|nr:hypothetical protein HHK36_013954 [Tetracentron sinense]